MTRLPRVERTPDGRRLVVDRAVDAAPGAVWDIMVDTERWPEWGPSVSAVRCPDRYIELGTTGEVQVAGGPWVSFEVTTCENYRWCWDVARLPATGHRVEPVGERTGTENGDRSRVVFEIPLLASGYAVVCRRALSNIAALAEA
jgi:hypothetical protein